MNPHPTERVKVVEGPTGHFAVDGYNRIYHISKDGGMLESQTVQAQLLLAILCELQKLNAPAPKATGGDRG